MARPRVTTKRDRQLNFSLTASELTILRRRAEASGLRLADYGRNQLLEYRQIAQATNNPFDRTTIQQLMRIGNNLNQIAKTLNTHPGSPIPKEITATLKELRAVLNKGLGYDPPYP